MSIDPHAEDLVILPESRELFPTRPHISTIWRWIQRGTRGHRLDTCHVGGRRYTSRQAVQRFPYRLNSNHAPVKPSAVRQRQIDQAEAELAAAGM